MRTTNNINEPHINIMPLGSNRSSFAAHVFKSAPIVVDTKVLKHKPRSAVAPNKTECR